MPQAQERHTVLCSPEITAQTPSFEHAASYSKLFTTAFREQVATESRGRRRLLRCSDGHRWTKARSRYPPAAQGLSDRLTRECESRTVAIPRVLRKLLGLLLRQVKDILQKIRRHGDIKSALPSVRVKLKAFPLPTLKRSSCSASSKPRLSSASRSRQ